MKSLDLREQEIRRAYDKKKLNKRLKELDRQIRQTQKNPKKLASLKQEKKTITEKLSETGQRDLKKKLAKIATDRKLIEEQKTEKEKAIRKKYKEELEFAVLSFDAKRVVAQRIEMLRIKQKKFKSMIKNLDREITNEIDTILVEKAKAKRDRKRILIKRKYRKQIDEAREDMEKTKEALAKRRRRLLQQYRQALKRVNEATDKQARAKREAELARQEGILRAKLIEELNILGRKERKTRQLITRRENRLHETDMNYFNITEKNTLDFIRSRDNVFFSLSVLNLGMPVQFADEAFPLPIDIVAGIGVKLLDELSLGIDAHYLLYEEHLKINLGAEYTLFQYAKLRAGYQLFQDEGALSLGAGISFPFRLDLTKLLISIDYAYTPSRLLQDNHTVSVGLSLL